MVDDEIEDPTDERHPIAAGLLALLAVGLAVGLVLGGAALAATQVLGVGDNESANDDPSSDASLYLPHPEKTGKADGPLITLPTGAEETKETDTGGPDPGPKESETKKESEISLSAGQTAVGLMEQIDLTGVYPGGEGAILQVQQFTDGKWDDFPVTASVSDETFSTYIQTSQTGLNKFRVIDSKSGDTSNEVRVRIG
ncbi:MAG TPA: hypothetical protein VNQ53_10870 [Nocardioides sp.]|nr:hypothetical protein [Nocardioides sp.]